MTAPVIVTARFFPLAGSHAALLAAITTAIPEVHREAGCELYAIHTHESEELLMIEKWDSVANLDAHAAGEAVRALDAAIAPLLAKPVLVERFGAVPAGTPGAGVL